MSQKSFFKREVGYWLLVVIPFLALPFVWDMMPDVMPIHWNVHNQPDNYASKTFALLMPPVINLFLYVLFVFLPKLDPRRKNYELFEGPWRLFRYLFHGLMIYMFVITIVAGTGKQLNIGFLVVFAVLAMFTIFGNFMGNIRSNFFVGIKTPWTLSDTEVWQKTHRLAAKLWFFASISMMMLVILLPMTIFIWFFIIYIAVLVVYPIVYSYVLFKKRHPK